MAPETNAEARAGAKGEVTVVEATRAQAGVGRRAAESRATIPHYAVGTEIDVTGAPVPVGVVVARACALALREHPRLNASYRDGRFEMYSRVNVGWALHGDDTLVVPTLFDADAKAVEELAGEAEALAARAGALTSPELAGATFTVHDLGPAGAGRFEPLIIPPQVAAMAVGAAVERPVVRDGAVVVRSVAELTLACDHRIVLPAHGARFLARVRELAQAPAR